MVEELFEHEINNIQQYCKNSIELYHSLKAEIIKRFNSLLRCHLMTNTVSLLL